MSDNLTRQKHLPTRRSRPGKDPFTWGLMTKHRAWVGDELFIKRRQIIQCPWFAILLTRICMTDTDRDPHDHSRSFFTFILTGGYTEDRYTRRDLSDEYQVHHPRFSVKYLPHTVAHRITHVDGTLRTLAILGPKHGDFHFWTPEGLVNHKVYDDDLAG